MERYPDTEMAKFASYCQDSLQRTKRRSDNPIGHIVVVSSGLGGPLVASFLSPRDWGDHWSHRCCLLGIGGTIGRIVVVSSGLGGPLATSLLSPGGWREAGNIFSDLLVAGERLGIYSLISWWLERGWEYFL